MPNVGSSEHTPVPNGTSHKSFNITIILRRSQIHGQVFGSFNDELPFIFEKIFHQKISHALHADKDVCRTCTFLNISGFSEKNYREL